MIKTVKKSLTKATHGGDWLAYDYTYLRSQIIKKYGTQEKFAIAMGISPESLSMKLSNINGFSQAQIDKASELLKLSSVGVKKCFFAH